MTALSSDPDETEGRALYRARANSLARAQISMASRRVGLAFAPAVGDAVEFLSDRQTEKGPSAGRVRLVRSSQCAISHSDTVEWFEVDKVRVARLTTHHKGGRLWILE